MCGCRTPKQRFITMACNSKSYAILWRVISEKLNLFLCVAPTALAFQTLALAISILDFAIFKFLFRIFRNSCFYISPLLKTRLMIADSLNPFMTEADII